MELRYKDQPEYYYDSLVAQASSNLKLGSLSELQAWQDSFRSLYYMLRKNMCDLFYVCTSQFVVTFIGSTKVKRTCDAHISQSTSILRSLLKQNDVTFSMPSVNCEGDNRSKSRLVFSGNNNVHGLYDFLFNFRFIMPSLMVVAVPLLYSAVPFEKSVLYCSHVTCNAVSQAEYDDDEPPLGLFYDDCVPKSWLKSI